MDTTTIEWVSSGSRWLRAGGVLLAYAGLCALVRQGWRQRQAAASGQGATAMSQASAITPATDDAPWVVYASQSGQAEAWAQHTALSLQAAHPSTHVLALDALTLDDLQQHPTLLFIVSTTGEGDAPDNALEFERRFMASGAAPLALPRLRYGLMALGDRDYSAYCGFGRRLDAWLQAAGAKPAFDRIEVNQADPAGLAAWRRQAAYMTALDDALPRPDEPAGAGFVNWRVKAVELLNSGSAGQPLVLVRLRVADGALPAWQAGDLAQILPPGAAPGHSKPREYSIANLPQDDELHLLVRRAVGSGGRLGEVSGWLTSGSLSSSGFPSPHSALHVGDNVQLRLRTRSGFNLNVVPQVPLVLIGGGSGLAGLRAHLQQRAAAIAASGQPAPEFSAWLLFGERSGQYDTLLVDELSAWQRSGVLSHLDRVFSRDTPQAPYVQHRLLAEADRLRTWVTAGAHILVCGSLVGMGRGVNEAMRQILGEAEMNALTRSGRIRRDLY
jgi:sulfite reductase (NADPH) flavoprotein alpha-component